MKRAFTLIELLVVIAILAIIVALVWGANCRESRFEVISNDWNGQVLRDKQTGEEYVRAPNGVMTPLGSKK